MNSHWLPSKIAVAAAALACFTTCVRAQEKSPSQSTLTLSEPLRATLYTEIMCPGCAVPKWDNGYLLHTDFKDDPAVVTIYNAEGKKVLTAHISPPDYMHVAVLASAVTHQGGVLVFAAGDSITDGNRFGFLAETDPAGHTIQSMRTEGFSTRNVCQATDGSIWALGYGQDSHGRPGIDKNVLRHYSFEKGLLGTFVPLDLKPSDAHSELAMPGKSFLYYGKDRISVYLALSGDYIELDTSTNKLTTWKVDRSSVVGDEPRGFAVTEDHRIFVAFANSKHMHGLYELRAVAGSPVAPLTPIAGTITSPDDYEESPQGAFYRLWGADGDELVVQRSSDGWGLSWVKVISLPTTD